jgi:hypothetical protein
VKKINQDAFQGSGLSGKIWIDSCTELNMQAFVNCSKITEVVLSPTNTPNIQDRCFYGCSSLTTVYNLNKINRIGEDAFSGSGLSGKIWIDSCTQLGGWAFSSCPDITDIVVTQGVYDSIKNSLTTYAPESVNWIPV